ncbi:MAG: GMC oxidoreductase, partial [Chloroflexota bacterium]
LPRETNRVELAPTVKDAWGLPVARITNSPHPNDLAMARWTIDRNAEILEAAGARTVWRVYVERITGNCSHQHGTTRMGHDPGKSVLNPWCRAHDIDNLYVIDGGSFPTATGINPTLTIMANAWRIADHVARERHSR